MQLHLVIDESALEPAAVASFSQSGSTAQWLLNTIIDKPHFTHDPWASESLPNTIIASGLAEQSAELSASNVILHLTPRALTSQFLTRFGNVWTAELPALDNRIAHYLLTRAPFIWVHLWQLHERPAKQSCTRTRIASHSLPCQTYSISDLRRLTYSALPSVFMSRLVWLANSPERKLDTIEQQAIDQGVFDTDQQQAEDDAMQSFGKLTSKTVTALDSCYFTNDSVGRVHKAHKGSLQTLFSAAALLVRQSYERFHHKLYTEHWQLAALPAGTLNNSGGNKSTRVVDIATTPVHAYTSIADSNDVIWADPHLIEHDECTYVFFEKMHKHHENAHIAYARLDNDGMLVNTGTAMTAEHHLSFPFVFAHEGDFYMIPETVSLNSVSLYKAKHFPDSWEHHATLLSDINAADTVIFAHESRWWMFTNCQSHRSVDERDELHVYFADDIHGPWHAHTLNPVLTGVDRSRMAGAVIKENGCLYRPSQYGAYRYGFGINLSRIDVLTPSAYRETAVWRMLPEARAGWSGCHSFAQTSSLTMIDRVRFSRR